MKYVWTISLIAAMGGLLFGYDWIVISGADIFYEKSFQLDTELLQGWAKACALVGCLIGALISGGLSDRFGRKRLLILSALLFTVSSLGTSWSGSFLVFVLWRITGGTAIGLASNLSPMYISEVAPAKIRGSLVSMNQFTIVIGILIAQAANYSIAQFGKSEDRGMLDKLYKPAGKELDRQAVSRHLAGFLPAEKRGGFEKEFSAAADIVSKTEQFNYTVVAAIVEQWQNNHALENLKIQYEELDLKLAGWGLHSWNETCGWRLMFAAAAIPSLIFFAAIFFVPESPRWLARNGRKQAARDVLTIFGGEDYAASAIADIEQTLVNETQRVDFRELLETRMKNILTIGIVLAVFQQWCGINVIFYYAKDVFSAAGYNVSQALLNIVYIGAINLIFTVLAIFFVDRVGRKILMLFGAAGLVAIYTLMGAFFMSGNLGTHVLALVLAAIGCYAMSLAPITWVVISEIFPNRIRGAAMSVCVFALWAACFILTLTFPTLNSRLGPACTFWIYAAICAAGFVFILLRLPETKGKTLEQIERELAD
ncbi:MAG: sugar porter family MFS transporter [Thermoguttaceae bacterium]